MGRKKHLGGKAANHESRKLFIIDIENYCGKPVLTEEDVAAAKDGIAKEFGLAPSDLVVIGTSHTSNLMSAGFAWRSARQVIMHGHDGADEALLKAVEDYKIDSFAEVYVMSGDGIFADLVERLANSGVAVTVASIQRCLSRKLSAAAPRVQIVAEHAAA